MSVRRQAARVVTIGALLSGLVAVGALPAYADADRVRVRAPGGSPPAALRAGSRSRCASAPTGASCCAPVWG